MILFYIISVLNDVKINAMPLKSSYIICIIIKKLICKNVSKCKQAFIKIYYGNEVKYGRK